jgi:hypothetical protein
MPTAIHAFPIHQGEDATSPPDFTDPRVRPWARYLVRLGVMDREGRSLKNGTVVLGTIPMCRPTHYAYKITWK